MKQIAAHAASAAPGRTPSLQAYAFPGQSTPMDGSVDGWSYAWLTIDGFVNEWPYRAQPRLHERVHSHVCVRVCGGAGTLFTRPWTSSLVPTTTAPRARA